MTADRSYTELSEAEKEVLWRFAAAGDEQSRRALIRGNRALVYAVAARFAWSGDREDLVQAGMIGLVTAVDRYDVRRGVPFGAFAFPFIKGEVLAAAAAMRGAKKSAFLRGDVPKTLSMEERLEWSESAALADSGCEAMMDRVEERIALSDAVARLTREERTLLYYRYIRRETQAETGKRLSLSQTGISRREKEILAKLRGWM
ncbi:MAG: sigma-70 family RNA polymerase sigma factor [Bacillota bacterium]|jgi:RNA polymerase sigma factor (sigma-70 family)